MPLGESSWQRDAMQPTVLSMDSIHEILGMHATWIASLAHAGLDEKTRHALNAEVLRTEKLVSAARKRSGGLDFSEAWTDAELLLAVNACETAIAQWQVLIALGDLGTATDADSASCCADLHESLAAARSMRDEITSHREAASLFDRLTCRDVHSDGEVSQQPAVHGRSKHQAGSAAREINSSKKSVS